ncbi:SDR family oxidoreductase [Nocardioides mangrovi]|uniref:SDR family oxidoreductase n=1 Tax=Nocardioides mangrovi TaxID=2874580 RepID=A0ABS7UI59_9ACTN|nr:SDR family oxidoreductase [Nocardioides mangrovi]MBZ5740710.1 SDR family oxidoreductase [Nocardioides mangrovi]
MTGQPISGSTALVTGANRGLGKAIAEELLARGAKTVYAAVRDPQSVTDARLTPVRVDVTDPASVFAAAALASDVDLLVNNAGIASSGSVFGPDGVEALRQQLETNAIGPLVAARAFAPTLEANGGGTIVNILSVLSWVTMAATSGYSASKAAAWSLTNAMRGELRGQGTHVVGVHVGYLDTDMAAHVDGPKTDPAELARQILDAVERGDDEVLGDDLSRGVKSSLSGPVGSLSV